jgi:hypothetical protein
MLPIGKLLRVAHCRYQRRGYHRPNPFDLRQLLALGLGSKDALHQVVCVSNALVQRP